MDTHTVLAEYDRDIRTRPFTTHPDFRFEWDGPVFRFTGRNAAPNWNGVLFAKLTADNADETIARQIAYFRLLGHAFEWKLHDYDSPADMNRRLEAAGLVPESEEGFAVSDIAEPLREFAPPPDVAIRKLTGFDDFSLIGALNASVYGNPEDSAALVDHLRLEHEHDVTGLLVYGAFVNTLLVSAGWLRFHRPGRFASLWGGATLPEWRGRGIYSALVSTRAREAKKKGFRWLTVDCSPDSRPILERRGFHVLSDITPWIWTPMDNR